MNLSYSTNYPKTLPPILAGKPTCFVPKILKGIEQIQPENENIFFYLQEYVMLQRKLKKDYKINVSRPKLHTIRKDEHNRWKTGNLIHFNIYNRSKNQLRFAPVLKCVSTQKIEIVWTDPDGVKMAVPCVYVNNRWIVGKDFEQLIYNDGFNSHDEFFAYFNTDFTGKIIHWTNLKY